MDYLCLECMFYIENLCECTLYKNDDDITNCLFKKYEKIERNEVEYGY